MSVEDGNNQSSIAGRSSVKKKSNTPEWDESFAAYVTESSSLVFRVLNKAKLFDDTLLAQAKLKLSSVPRTENGECKCFYWFPFINHTFQ